MKFIKRLTIVAAIVVSLNFVGLIIAAANAEVCTTVCSGGDYPVCTTICSGY